uniref:Secreted protein n=1 Tax=Panagrolaimus sp. JU765 TaxID=591449 RepID=A0AC34QMC3_9BILA
MKYFFVFLIAIVFQFCQTSTFAGSQGYLLTSAAGGGPDSQEMDPNQQKQNTDDAFYDENYELFDDDYAEPGISAPSKTRPVGTRMGGRGGFRNQEDSADGHDFRDGIFEQG